MDPQTPNTPPQQTNPAPMNAAPAPAAAPAAKGGTIGPLIGIVIIVVILALGAGYYWMTELQMRNLNQDEQTVTPGTADQSQNGASTASDTPDSIENDLNNTSVDAGADLETNVNNQFNQ